MESFVLWLKRLPPVLLFLVGAALAAAASVGGGTVLAALLNYPFTRAFMLVILATSTTVSLLIGAFLLASLGQYRRTLSRMAAEKAALIEVLSLNEAILNPTRDGILVVDNRDRPVGFNQRYVERWRIPVTLAERGSSDPHEMEIALTRERDLARLIFDMQLTLLAILQDDTIITCNKAMSELLGQPPTPELNQPIEVILDRLIEQPGYLDRKDITNWLADKAETTEAQQHLLLRSEPKNDVHTFLAYRRRLPTLEARQLLALTDITELEEKRREIEHLATTDVLTGLLNRARFNEVLDQQLYMVHRYNVNFSLAMFDVDRFKAINDTKGHLVGDRVLTEIGQILKSRLRGGDTAARWGGDEFMILMPETGLAGARAVITYVRDALRNWNFRLEAPLSCSFGITTVLEDDTTQSVIGRVDTAMYNAKRNGGKEKIAVALAPAG